MESYDKHEVITCTFVDVWEVSGEGHNLVVIYIIISFITQPMRIGQSEHRIARLGDAVMPVISSNGH